MRPNAAILASTLTACAGTAAAAPPPPGVDPHQPPPMVGGPATPAPARTLKVSADGRVTVRPDLALVQTGVRLTAKDPQKASADANARMATLLAELKRLGVAERDVQTSQFTLTPERPWENGRQLPVQGYTAASTVAVKVRALERLPELLARLPSVGANAVDSVSFAREELGPARDEALALAVGAARARAQAVARAAGVALGEVLTIEVQHAGSPMPMGSNVMLRSAAMAAPEEAPVSPGELEVTAGVELVFAIR